jgi:L-iditol 2-dehydrogenase
MPPVITGHECVGKVVETGESVTTFTAGDRVAVEPHVGCGECYYCQTGEYQQCLNKRLIGVGDWIGGFAEYIVVEESMCYRLPDGVSFEIGALLEPYNVGLHAVRRAQIQNDETVGIIGTGTIGLMTLLAAKTAAHHALFAVDISETKLRLARELGADYCFDATDGRVSERLTAIAPLGLDVVFLTVPSDDAIDEALSVCRRRGRVILIATIGSPVSVDTHKIQQFERAVLGTAMYNRTDWLASIEHLGAGYVPQFQRLISRQISLDEAPDELLELAQKRKPDNIKTMITSFGE